MSRTRKLRIKLPGYSASTEILVTFVNPGDWFKQRYLIGVDAGFFCLFYIVEGTDEQCALDELVDSPWGHIVKEEEPCPHSEENDWADCDCEFAGNYGDRVDFSDIRILERLT